MNDSCNQWQHGLSTHPVVKAGTFSWYAQIMFCPPIFQTYFDNLLKVLDLDVAWFRRHWGKNWEICWYLCRLSSNPWIVPPRMSPNLNSAYVRTEILTGIHGTHWKFVVISVTKFVAHVDKHSLPVIYQNITVVRTLVCRNSHDTQDEYTTWREDTPSILPTKHW